MEDLSFLCFFHKYPDPLIRLRDDSFDMIISFQHGQIQTGMAVQRNVSVAVGNDLDYDIFRIMNKCLNRFQFFLVNIELGRLDAFQGDILYMRGRIFRDRSAALVTESDDMRRMKPKLFVFNKCDTADREKIETLRYFGGADEETVFVSALTGEGTEELIKKLSSIVNAGKRKITYRFSPSDGALLNLIFREADSVETDYRSDEVICSAVVDEKLYGKLLPYIIEE